MEIKKPKIVEKPWGREIWLAHEDEYAGKILEINKDEQSSLQYHEIKKESMYVLEGTMKIITGDGSEHILNAGDSITLLPGEVHRLYAIEDLRIIEVSTPELDDVVRLKDKYGRAQNQ